MNHLVLFFLMDVHQVRLVTQPFTKTPFLFNVLNCVAQLLKDHHALTVDRKTPTEVDFEVFRPFIDGFLVDWL